jgi:hypothetical protein
VVSPAVTSKWLAVNRIRTAVKSQRMSDSAYFDALRRHFRGPFITASYIFLHLLTGCKAACYSSLQISCNACKDYSR